MNKLEKDRNKSSSRDDRIEMMIEAGIVDWNGNKLEKVEPAVVNRRSRQVSDILVEMRK